MLAHEFQPLVHPSQSPAIFPFDEVDVRFLFNDWADFLAVVFLGGTFAFAAVFEGLEAGFFALLDWMFDGMNSSFL